MLLDCLARLLSDLGPDPPTRLALPNGRAIDGIAMWRDALDLEVDQVAATRLAIDREIEERQVPRPPRELQPGLNRPDLLRL